MLFRSFAMALLAAAMANGAALEERAKKGKGKGGGTVTPVCSGNASPLCCEVDVAGVVDLSCTSVDLLLLASETKLLTIRIRLGQSGMYLILPR